MSRILAQTLTDITLDDEEILNSHDVVSLFTKSLEEIKERLTDVLSFHELSAVNSWKNRTKLLVEDVLELFEFILILFCIQGPDILSEIRDSNGQSSVTDVCRHFHGIPRVVGHNIS